ncbi:hypothetical protein LX36DRAFT_714216 [Colletotrichum falcatum]|nr:hypothetical protein LX36DRAFT_714216 [Colletotrichum falcatum]
MSRWTDNTSYESEWRLLGLRRQLADDNWPDLVEYASYLDNEETTSDERAVIHANILREVRARWTNNDTTLMPKFYRPLNANHYRRERSPTIADDKQTVTIIDDKQAVQVEQATSSMTHSASKTLTPR